MIYSKEQTADIHKQKFAYLLIEEQEHVLTITLNRPDQRNALNEVITRELAFALSYAHHYNHIWAVVLAAKGDVFCAGADLKALMGQLDTTSGSTIPEEGQKIVLGDLFNGLHKPCIAQVAKPVFAGGFLLLGGCTHVVAAASTRYTLSEVKRGIWPFQVMASLLKIMPERKVLDWCIQGRTWSAEEAYEAGLITYLVEDGDLEKTVHHLVANICENSPTAIRLGLKAIQDMKQVSEVDLHKFLQQRLMEVVQTADAQEGMTAFQQKRKPSWKGE